MIIQQCFVIEGRQLKAVISARSHGWEQSQGGHHKFLIAQILCSSIHICRKMDVYAVGWMDEWDVPLCFISLTAGGKTVAWEEFKWCVSLPTSSMHYMRCSCAETDSVIYCTTHDSFVFCLFWLADAIRTKRMSLGAPRSISTEDKEKESERKLKSKDHDMPGVSH